MGAFGTQGVADRLLGARRAAAYWRGCGAPERARAGRPAPPVTRLRAWDWAGRTPDWVPWTPLSPAP
jgi:hypothetical protein